MSLRSSGLQRNRSPLLRRRRERRQLPEVALVVLDDDGGLEVRRNLLETVDRSQRLGAVGVEDGHAVAVIIFLKVREVAREHHGALLLQPHQQALMARRMS